MEIDQEVIRELENWVAAHSKPDKSLLIIGKTSYSPNQILEEVKKATELGATLYSAFKKNYMK